ncbi:MAG: CusA/CzcA family heavy metal efflux RND transporter [Steroidobacteraceae bacterium]
MRKGIGLTTIIEQVIRNRLLVWLLVAAGAVASVYAIRTAPLDAIPDISDPQIIVYAKWQRSPQLLEEEVAAPIVRALLGAPGVKAIRGTSHMGYAFIFVVLGDGVQREPARQRVLDRINAIRPQLPPDATITLGPDAGSMGWIYQYALVDRQQTRDLRELRLLNENQVKPSLQSVPGIAEVASVGGLEKQYQFRIFPPLLASAGLSLPSVIGTLRSAFDEVGGRTIEVTNRDYQLRGVIEKDNLDKLEHLVLGRGHDGKVVRMKDIGYLQVGYDLRRSIADLDGAGEVVGGIVVMEQGQNVLAVSRALERKLADLKVGLPAGIEVLTTYNRSSLIWGTLKSFLETLAYELLVVIVIIALFLRNLRSAIAPICVLLLATLFTALPLAVFNQTINLLSLAGLAIAIGEMIDATIVIVENCTAEIALRGQLDAAARRALIVRAMATVVRPLLFSMLIILASFLPIFFLGAREARLFDPLAFAKTFAIGFSTLLTLFLLPILVVWIFNKQTHSVRSYRESGPVRVYRWLLGRVIRFRYAFVAASILLMIPAVILLSGFRSDYMPEMEEGSVLYMPTTLPGIPAREAGWILQQMDRKLKAFPEVASVFGKLGRADSATDSAPVTMIETTVLLHPHAAWRKGLTKAKLIAEMDAALQVTGFVNSWTQPISTRVLMQDTGIQTAVGIKVKGPEVTGIESVAKQVEELLRNYPGTTSVIAERISEGYFVDVRSDPEKMADHEVTVEEAQATVRYGIGGDNVLRLRQADRTSIPLSVQYASEYADSTQKVRMAPVVTADGRSVPLSDVADVAVRKMPEMIRSDNGELAGYVYVYLGQVTAPDYVKGAQRYLGTNLALPTGYSLEWTGIYRYSQEARARLAIVVPVTLLIIFGLLLLAFRSIADSALIMLSVPFALIGGVFLQGWLGYSMTTAVIIGYVALFAVAIQTGIIMIVFIRQALANRKEGQSYMDAVVEGSAARLRPKLMTVAATVLSLFPVMFSTGQGMELMKPIATPTIGGMATSAIYVLFLIPCLFAIGEDIRRRRGTQAAP